MSLDGIAILYGFLGYPFLMDFWVFHYLPNTFVPYRQLNGKHLLIDDSKDESSD